MEVVRPKLQTLVWLPTYHPTDQSCAIPAPASITVPRLDLREPHSRELPERTTSTVPLETATYGRS